MSAAPGFATSIATRLMHADSATRSTTSGESLDEYLKRRRVTLVDVVGIATDYCVAATVRGALACGYSVRILSDLVAAVDPVEGQTALDDFVRIGAEVVTTSSLLERVP